MIVTCRMCFSGSTGSIAVPLHNPPPDHPSPPPELELQWSGPGLRRITTEMTRGPQSLCQLKSTYRKWVSVPLGPIELPESPDSPHRVG